MNKNLTLTKKCFLDKLNNIRDSLNDLYTQIILEDIPEEKKSGLTFDEALEFLKNGYKIAMTNSYGTAIISPKFIRSTDWYVLDYEKLNNEEYLTHKVTMPGYQCY